MQVGDLTFYQSVMRVWKSVEPPQEISTLGFPIKAKKLLWICPTMVSMIPRSDRNHHFHKWSTPKKVHDYHITWSFFCHSHRNFCGKKICGTLSQDFRLSTGPLRGSIHPFSAPHLVLPPSPEGFVASQGGSPVRPGEKKTGWTQRDPWNQRCHDMMNWINMINCTIITHNTMIFFGSDCHERLYHSESSECELFSESKWYLLELWHKWVVISSTSFLPTIGIRALEGSGTERKWKDCKRKILVGWLPALLTVWLVSRLIQLSSSTIW